MKKLLKGLLSACVLFLLVGNTATAQNITETTLKKNMVPIERPVEKIQSLEPINYSFNNGTLSYLNLSNQTQYGFKLASAKDVFPELIKTTGKSYTAGKNFSKSATYQQMDNESLVPVLVAAIQEQQKAIEQLQKELKELKATK